MVDHVFIGLGNPGPKHTDNRHNVGFMVVDAIADHYGFSPFKSAHDGQLSQGKIGDAKVLCFKPMTFMNLSGEPAGKLARFFKIPTENITVFHDELDILVGKIKVKTGGGNGGHNGLKSLDSHLGKNYQRVRIGIDHPGHKDRVSGYVLSDFTNDERLTTDEITHDIVLHADILVAKNENLFTTKLAMATKG